MPYVAPTTSANPQPNPINRYSARSSYFGASGFHPSPGLERARRPFRTKNALTGLLILSFVGGVYSYSISAVKQDDFSDLPTVSAADREGKQSIEEEMAEKQATSSLGNRGIGAMMGMGSSPQGQGVKIVNDTTKPQGQQFPSGQPTPLSTPLPPPPGAKTVGAAAANAIVQTVPVDSTTSASSVRQKSRFIVGAPDVDRLGRVGERSDVDPSIDGRRVV